MKFSGSLFENKDIGNRIFDNSIIRTKTLLKDVFALHFECPDPNIIKVNRDMDEWIFEVIFKMNESEITAIFNYDVEDHCNDIVREILTISEYNIEKVIIPGVEEEGKKEEELYLENVKRIQDYLESRYELNFTPLDPAEKESNIISVTSNNQDHLELPIEYT